MIMHHKTDRSNLFCLHKIYHQQLRILPNSRDTAQQNMKGTAGQKRVSTNYLKEVQVPVATIEEKKQVIQIIEEKMPLIQNTTQIVNSTLQTLQTMKMSVLKQAFEGKLVPQDPNDEPVEKLLERIKKEKS